ncbi:hypothetical protein ABZ614_34895 [Streptomyces sp. NPDC013178]|uniref:hypothetical protein n=1 Tax=Streptomyces sp. NPDC013178 TaxID=3155118 RepID=UPI0033E64670
MASASASLARGTTFSIAPQTSGSDTASASTVARAETSSTSTALAAHLAAFFSLGRQAARPG